MRKLMYRATFFILICLLGRQATAQTFPTQQDHDTRVDSFIHVLKIAKEDTNKVNTLNLFGQELFNWSEEERPKAMENFRLALSLSERLNYQKGKANTYFWMAESIRGEGKYEQAFKYYSYALKIRETEKDNIGITQCYLGMGAIYVEQKDYSKALGNYNIALKFASNSGDKRSIAEANELLGLFFLHKDPPQIPEALKYYLIFLKLSEELGDKEWISTAYNQVGISYLYLEDYSDALKYFLDMEKKSGEATFLGNLLSCYRGLKDYRAAISLINPFIEKHQRENNKRYVVFGFAHGGHLYLEMAEELSRNKGNTDTIGACLINALKNFEASRKIVREENLKKIYSGTKFDYGMIYKMKAELQQKKRGSLDTIQNYLNIALDSFLTELKNPEERRFNVTEADCYIKSGEVASMQASLSSGKQAAKKYAEAMQYLDSGLVIAKKTSDKQAAKDATWGMVEIYKKTKNYDKTLETLKYYDDLKDSISTEETNNKIEQMRTASETIVGATEAMTQYEKVINDLHFNYLKKEDSLRFQERLTDERLKQQQKEVELKQAELALANKQNELNQLTFLKTQAELQTEQSQRKEKEKQLTISEQQQDLQKSQLKLQRTQLSLNESQLQSARKQRYLYGGVFILMLLVFGFIYYNIRNRQKTNSLIAVERLKTEKANAARKMTELELQSLRTQLNPHFMFNSLNAIQELILMEDTENSHVYLSRFSELLRMLLDNANQPFISLRKEIHFLELYLSLENLRIPDLEYVIEVDPKIDSEKTLIPNMMLQPYIENAIWHGLSHKKQNKLLELKVHQNGESILFEIEDNGVGRKKATELKSLYRKEHKSKGMELLSKRFNLLSKEYGAHIQTAVTDLTTNGQDASGTLVEVRVPLSLSEKANQAIYDTSHYN